MLYAIYQTAKKSASLLMPLAPWRAMRTARLAPGHPDLALGSATAAQTVIHRLVAELVGHKSRNIRYKDNKDHIVVRVCHLKHKKSASKGCPHR